MLRAPVPLLRALVPALLLVLCIAGTAVAQESPSPSPVVASATGAKAGFCSPWHHCVALGTIGLAGLATLALLAGFAYQSRGFDTMEHRMGSPQGVPKKE